MTADEAVVLTETLRQANNAATEAMDGAQLIAVERLRQIEVEGYTAGHDASHLRLGYEDALVRAAVCYATPPDHRLRNYSQDDHPRYWPWAPEYWKPCPDDRVRELVKAGALIAAEIDRLRSIGRSA